MFAQVNTAWAQLALDADPRAKRVVLMGSGEPGLNIINAVSAVKVLKTFFECSASISTVGINLPALLRGLAGTGCSLQLSLHGSSDTRRQLLVPGSRHSIAEMLELGMEYQWQENAGGSDVSLTLNFLQLGKNFDAMEAIEALASVRHCAEIKLTQYIPAKDEIHGSLYRLGYRMGMEEIMANAMIMKEAGFVVKFSVPDGTEKNVTCGNLTPFG